MIFTSGTNIQALHDAVSQGVDLAAGRVIGRRGQIRAFEGHFVRSPEELSAMPGPDGEHPCGLPRYHVLENFYLAKTEHLLRFPYDAELKVGEHMDWLISMWLGNARLTIVDDVYCIDPAFRPRNGDATQYTQMRERATRLWRAAMKKRGTEMGFARFVQRLYPYQRPLIVDCRVALERKSS